MKKSKLILVLVLILSALGFMFNAHNQYCVSAELFLSQIEVLAADESSDEPVCTARKVCDFYGSYVECKGWKSCDVGFASVTCDGRKYTC